MKKGQAVMEFLIIILSKQTHCFSGGKNYGDQN